MNQVTENTDFLQTKQVMPAPSPTAQALKGMDPEALLGNMPMDLVNQIVSEWRQARSVPGLSAAGDTTVDQYSRNAERLERKYSQEYNVEYGLLNPVDCIKSFFFHSKELSDATWNLYRHSLLHTMNARAREMDARGAPQKSLMTALAALIVATKKPQSFIATGQEQGKKSKLKSAKSIRLKYFVELVSHLAGGFPAVNLSARRAQSFAMAALATGLRPIEWTTTELREPNELENKGLGQGSGWLAMDVFTAKRKDNEDDWVRTLLIPPGIYQIHIRQHHEAMRSYIASSRGRDPAELYIRQCSAIMTTACEQLWPKRPDLRFTLKTLRSQARANFASKHGVHIAAAMMGHSPETSSSYYAGMQRANLPKRSAGFGDIPILVPGENVVLKAAEFMRHERVLAQSEGHHPVPGNSSS